MAVYHAFTFTVHGRGMFPFDMLRYDRCSPLGSADVDGLSGLEHRDVTLIGYAPKGNIIGPTGARWLSFGWVVKAGSVAVL